MNTSEFSLFTKSNCNRGTECNSFVSEELEAEEDELRRNEEIKEMMQNAFDDLDEDYQSINSSSYLASLSGCCNSKTSYSELSPWSQKQTFNEQQATASNNCHYHSTDLHSKLNSENKYPPEYLSNIQELQTELQNIQKQFQEEKSKWMEKFFNEEEEKKLALKKHEEINNLFYESQVMLLEKETELKSFQEKLKIAEEEKNKALEEVQQSQLVIRELEERLISEEKKHFLREEEADNLIKKVSSKEEQKFFDYQKEIQILTEKLSFKEKKCAESEQQLQELQQLHKSVVAEKSDTIAKLISNLETCQSQCQKFISASNDKLNQNNSDGGNSFNKFQAEARHSLPVNIGGNSKLVEELCRAYSSIKEKSSEIKFLQEQLKSCIKQIKLNKETESKFSSEINTLQEKLLNLENENQQLKNRTLGIPKETVVHQTDSESTNQYLHKEKGNEIASLNKKLETSFEQCDTLKKMYLDVSTAKEKLIFQCQQLQSEVEKLRSENANLKNSDKDLFHIPKHNDSFGQESMYLKYCPRDNQEIKFDNSQACAEVEDLKNKLKICEGELENALEHAKEIEVLRIVIREYISGTETKYQQRINELRDEYSKKIIEIESKHQEQFCQFETEFKEQVLKVSTEEIKYLSNIFQKHFDDISETMSRLQNELDNKTRLSEALNKQLDDANKDLKSREMELENLKSKHNSSLKDWKEQVNTMKEKYEKLLSEIDKIYTKYKVARKAAVDLKQMLNARSQLFQKHQQFYAQTLNEIQNYLNETLDGKSRDEKSMTRFDITKEDLVVPDEEINAAMVAIKKQLESIKHYRQ